MAAIAHPQMSALFNLSRGRDNDDEDPDGHRRCSNSAGRHHYKEEVEVPDSEDDEDGEEDELLSDSLPRKQYKAPSRPI